MRTNELHSALKTTVVAEVTEAGIHYKQVRLQHGKDDFLDTLHAARAHSQRQEFKQRTSCIFSDFHDLLALFTPLNATVERFYRPRI